MNKEFNIRFITLADAAGALAVYAPYVLNTANTFEYEVPSIEAFTQKIEKIKAQYPWLVCEHNGVIVGYAYGSTHRERAAYQWSPESTVYLAESYHRLGIASILYNALFKMMRAQGYFSLYASILVTNESSVAFHRKMGFEEIGLFKNVGYKLGAWHTNLWFQYFLQDHIINPPMPIPIGKLADTGLPIQILEAANGCFRGNVG